MTTTISDFKKSKKKNGQIIKNWRLIMKYSLIVILLLAGVVITGCKAKKEDGSPLRDSTKTEDSVKGRDTLTLNDLLDSNKVKEEKEKLKKQFDQKKKQLDEKMDEVQKELDKIGK